MGAMKCSKPTTAPCREACPAGIDVPRYIRHIRDGHFEKALAVIRERIPFPFVCGYACVHPCEAKCARLQFDEAVAIRMLKRVAAEKGGRKPAKMAKRPPTGKRIAVIGSGPCGLTAAHYLNVLGHRVTVYEALPLPGGMLRYGIPDYRLPEDIVDREIGMIRDGGVEIIAGAPVSSAEALKEKGYDAVLAATGAWKPALMGIPGEDSPNFIDGLSFLMQVNEGKRPAIGRKVIVVGERVCRGIRHTDRGDRSVCGCRFGKSGRTERRDGLCGSGQSNDVEEGDLCRGGCRKGPLDHHRGHRPGETGLRIHRPVFGRRGGHPGGAVGRDDDGASRDGAAGRRATGGPKDCLEEAAGDLRFRGMGLFGKSGGGGGIALSQL